MSRVTNLPLIKINFKNSNVSLMGVPHQSIGTLEHVVGPMLWTNQVEHKTENLIVIGHGS